jgi:hypothetical protein
MHERLTRSEVRDHLFRGAVSTLAIAALSYTLFDSFSPHIAEIMRRRSEGTCEACGRHFPRHELIAGHWDHDRSSSQYNDPENGVMHCHMCETDYHLRYAGHNDPYSIIGLSQRSNDWAVLRNMVELPVNGQKKMATRYPSQWAAVCARAKKDHALQQLRAKLKV